MLQKHSESYRKLQYNVYTHRALYIPRNRCIRHSTYCLSIETCIICCFSIVICIKKFVLYDKNKNKNKNNRSLTIVSLRACNTSLTSFKQITQNIYGLQRSANRWSHINWYDTCPLTLWHISIRTKSLIIGMSFHSSYNNKVYNNTCVCGGGGCFLCSWYIESIPLFVKQCVFSHKL